MKKTVQINLGGVHFTIEEDAYEVLHRYLDDIESRLCTMVDGKERLSQVEARVVEIFTDSRAPETEQTINLPLVYQVMSVIGVAAQFGPSKCVTPPPVFATVTKKLFRDPDHKVFGGVCSGLAAYSGLDISLVRILALILILFGGVSLWVYIILWIVIPMAQTPAERDMLNRERRQ